MKEERILVVDDDVALCELVRAALELEGITVDEAHHVVEADRLIHERKPDAVVLDIGLPGIDGYEVARRLRATDAGKQMVLVALTGYGRPEDRDRALASGFDAHLVKPVDPDELSRLLASLQPAERQPAGQA